MIYDIRCGADVNIKDKAAMTAKDVIEERALPGHDEILHWFNKFSPGLKEVAMAGDVDKTEELLKSWCRTKVYKNAKVSDLVKRSEQTIANTKTIMALLKKYEDTNDLAFAVLAGSPKRVNECMKKGNADINAADISYQYHYPNSPCVSQPLIAAAWEQDNYDLVDTIMNFHPDTSIMYANHRWKTEMPLFFHVLSGKPKPSKVSISNRVIRGSDLTRSNYKGQTILFEAIKEGLSIDFVRSLLKRGIDFTWRDYKGRSARDYAEELLGDEYVDCLDAYVTALVADRNLPRLHYMIVRSYDYLTTIIYSSKAAALALAHDLREKRSYKEIVDILDVIPKIKRHIWKCYKASESGDVDALRQLLTQIEQVAVAQNHCGQTLLHSAVLHGRLNVVAWAAAQFPQLLHLSDNLLRTPLHYAMCLYGLHSEMANCLLNLGASTKAREALGKYPGDYTADALGTISHEELRQNIVQFYTRVYVENTNFDYRLRSAATSGSFEAIASVVQEAKENHVDLRDYSDLLFDCIDTSQTDAAMYLIDNGADPEVWARYEACDPGNEQCAQQKCRHPIVSLKQRADEMGYESIASYIDRVKTAGTRTTAVSSGTRISSRGGSSILSTPFDEMALYGSL